MRKINKGDLWEIFLLGMVGPWPLGIICVYHEFAPFTATVITVAGLAFLTYTAAWVKIIMENKNGEN